MHSIILCFGVDVLSKLGRNMNNRIKSLDNTKWILTLLICLYHIQFMGDEKYSTLFYWVKDLGNCVVQVFSLISGFLFFRNIRNLADVRDRAIKKYTALFIPFILWNIINYSINTLIDTHSIKAILENCDFENYILKGYASPHFWYIYMLMFWAVFSPMLFFAYKDKRLLVLLFLSQIFYFVNQGNNILHSRFIYIEYTWGGLLGFYYPNIISKLEELKGIKKKVVILCSWGVYFLTYYLHTHFNIEMKFFLWIIAIRAISLFMGTIYLVPLKLGSKLNYQYSFWLFAVHYWLDARVSTKMYPIDWTD